MKKIPHLISMLEEYRNERRIWEERIDEIQLRSDLLVTERIIEFLGNVSGKTILDLGCGNGKVARKLARKSAKVTGVDREEKQIAFASSIEHDGEAIVYITEDMLFLSKINLPHKTYDIILSLMMHLYLSNDDLERSFKEIAMHMHRGSRFLLATIHPARASLEEYCQHSRSQIHHAVLPTLSGIPFETTYYHHSMETLKNAVSSAELKITNIIEPMPTQAEIEAYPLLFHDANQGSAAYCILDIEREF